MKKLLLTIGLIAAALSANAQSSNTVQAIRLTYTDGVGATNNTTINVSAREAEGFLLNFNKDLMVAIQQTNTPPTFQQSIRGAVNTVLLAPLAQQARADERKQAKVEAFVPLIGELWDSMTAQERSQLTTLANKYATNQP
jgi:non-homologous end joining protein Ku